MSCCPEKPRGEAEEHLPLDKKLVLKEDGRYIIFYRFSEAEVGEPSKEEGKRCRS